MAWTSSANRTEEIDSGKRSIRPPASSMTIDAVPIGCPVTATGTKREGTATGSDADERRSLLVFGPVPDAVEPEALLSASRWTIVRRHA
jgi:hypothetical protein